MTTAESEEDLIHAVIADHREIEEVFTELEQLASAESAEAEPASADPAYRRDLVEHAIALLVRHSVAEEQYLYPEVRDQVPGGDLLVDEEINEHTETEELMKQLERLSPSEPRFEQLVGDLITKVRHHFQEEENELLPKLHTVASPEHLGAVGAKMILAKDSAPTRPHPSAPKTPPANLLTDPSIGLIDKLRDALGARNT